MEAVFGYVIRLGAAVMMPVIFALLGLSIRIGFGLALKSGLKVGVGFVGLGVVTALLTTSLGPVLKDVVALHGLDLEIFDMGWPAAAAVAYNTAVGAFIIPVCVGLNVLLLALGFTRTVNIDFWNYWHFAFLGAMTYFFAQGAGWAHPLAWGFFAAGICFVITLVMADRTARRFRKYYPGTDGISIPQPFCQSFTVFAVLLNRALDRVPGMNRLSLDAEGLRRKFGVAGEPLVLGVVIGCAIGCLACDSWAALGASVPRILGLGIKMGAVMELIPRITALFIEGLKPISDATREFVAKRFGMEDGLSIGMSPAVVIGHPTTLVVSILLIPVILALAVALPGNRFLPLASLAGLFYLFPCVLPITKGNVARTFLIGLVALVAGLYFCTALAPHFTAAARDVAAVTADAEMKKAVSLPAGFSSGASLDFAGSLFCWAHFEALRGFKWIGAALLGVLAAGLLAWNRRMLRREGGNGNLETQTKERETEKNGTQHCT